MYINKLIFENFLIIKVFLSYNFFNNYPAKDIKYVIVKNNMSWIYMFKFNIQLYMDCFFKTFFFKTNYLNDMMALDYCIEKKKCFKVVYILCFFYITNFYLNFFKILV